MKILIFHAKWCGPCKQYDKIIELVKAEIKLHDVIFEVIDADEKEDLVDQYKVRSLPTTIILDEDNKELFRQSGIIPKLELINIINNI